jgi:hypothetical protein
VSQSPGKGKPRQKARKRKRNNMFGFNRGITLGRTYTTKEIGKLGLSLVDTDSDLPIFQRDGFRYVGRIVDAKIRLFLRYACRDISH